MDFLDRLRKHRDESIEFYRKVFYDEYENFVIEYHLLLPIKKELDKEEIPSDIRISTYDSYNDNYMSLNVGEWGSVEVEEDKYHIIHGRDVKRFDITDRSIILIVGIIVGECKPQA